MQTLVFPIYKNPEKNAFCYNKMAKIARKGRAAAGFRFICKLFSEINDLLTFRVVPSTPHHPPLGECMDFATQQPPLSTYFPLIPQIYFPPPTLPIF
jgi:hypothetical protein